MINPKRSLITVALCLFVSSCSSGIALYIENSKSFPYERIITDERIEELGFKKSSYCSNPENACISYLYAQPITAKKLRYSLEIESGNNNSKVDLALSRSSLEDTYSGTVVLLHGFRASKEFMINSALYFRFLGYDVVIPDLFGHGDTGGNKRYGIGDSGAINNLIDDLVTRKVIKSDNLYLLGNSMGGLTAALVSSNRDDIKGVILQAPMLQFDKAVYNYAKANYPLFGNLISEGQFRQGAILALERAKIKLSETRIEPLLTSSDTPILLFSSPSDLVAPYTSYKELNSENIKVISLKNRNHPSLAAIGETEHSTLKSWLTTEDK